MSPKTLAHQHLTAAEIVDRAENGTLSGCGPDTARALIESVRELDRAAREAALDDAREDGAEEGYREGYAVGYADARKKYASEEADQ